MIYGIWTAVGLVALVLAVATIFSVLRNSRVSAGEKVVWIIASIVFPIFGAIVYFTVRRDW